MPVTSDDKTIYVTLVVLTDHNGDEYEVSVWESVDEVDRQIEATDEADFIRLTDIEGNRHRKRKETVLDYRIERFAAVSIKRARTSAAADKADAKAKALNAKTPVKRAR